MIRRIFEQVKNNSNIKKFLEISLIICIALYTFSIPSFSGREKWNLVSYGLMIVTAFLVFAKYFFYDKFFFDKRLLILLFFALETFIGTAIWSHSFRHWITIILLYITFVIFYYGFSAISNKRLIYKILSWSLFAFGLYFGFIYKDYILKFNLNTPLGTVFDNVNTIGTYFSLASAMFLYIALTPKKRIERLYIIPCFIMLFLGFFTGSRHFIITTGAAFILTIFVSFKKRKWLALILIVSSIALVFAVIQLPQLASLKERFNRGITTIFGIGNAKYDPSAVQRMIWPRYGFYLGIHNIFFGYGADGFLIYSGIGTYSHNTYSDILCNFGIVGGVLFYLSLLYPFLLAIRSKDEECDLVKIIVVFYLVKGFFGVYFGSKDAYLMIALIMFLTKSIHLRGYIGIKDAFNPQRVDYCEINI